MATVTKTKGRLKYIEPNMQLVIDVINKFENGEDEV